MKIILVDVVFETDHIATVRPSLRETDAICIEMVGQAVDMGYVFGLENEEVANFWDWWKAKASTPWNAWNEKIETEERKSKSKYAEFDFEDEENGSILIELSNR